MFIDDPEFDCTAIVLRFPSLLLPCSIVLYAAASRFEVSGFVSVSAHIPPPSVCLALTWKGEKKKAEHLLELCVVLQAFYSELFFFGFICIIESSNRLSAASVILKSVWMLIPRPLVTLSKSAHLEIKTAILYSKFA